MSDNSADAIRVLLADDETLIRDALRALLNLEGDIDVVAVAGSGEEVLEMTDLAVDVVVLDLQMPGIDGIETAERLQSTYPDIATMIVTGHGRPGYLRRALAAGVRGFLPKTVSATVLASVVRTVHEGGRYVDPELAAEAISAGDSPLTPREADVLELSGAGAPIEEVAQRAHLSPGTVRNYLSSAMGKLDATNRHEAVQIARRHGWI
ncbi:LuxR family two component transcriptional regulator [Antricoccus suffuscus]|uniref:LuxR family two component transcriptional regulator n=1 Tax=Antricoccus suffuscus TaxID=1629062 RepID=A0A2T1A2D2_9ACTN|nr:response regulator transcription factor [Antricoccus suffuscus]PRZ42743.1 LuxR family two component transcriptional regulator [Antricoccus suffuscus]